MPFSDLIDLTRLTRFWGFINAKKYDKTGGEISGNVKIDGNLTLDIEDEDYDAGITFTKSLDTNAGVILTATGYANANGSNTNYKPVARNFSDPINNYDLATKHYVDDNTATPTLHLVELNIDGSVKNKASTLVYSTIASNLTNPKREDYLDIFWENGQGTNSWTRFKARAVGVSEVNNGDVMFEGELFYLTIPVWLVFTLSKENVLTTVAIISRENTANKTQDIISNSTSTILYPSAKAVFDQFQRKPVTVWETDGTGLVGLNTDMSASPSWQLTNLDFSPFKRVKIYTKAAQKSGATASASTTPAVVLEMSLDPRAAGPYGGHYIGSYMGQKPNDANRLFTVTCAISADKTSFAVIRMTTLYGTAATSNSDVNSYVFKIEGYYD